MAKQLKTITLELNMQDALVLADFIEFNIFSCIRTDDNIDNMRWL